MNDETFQAPNHPDELEHFDATITPLSSPPKKRQDHSDVSAVLDLLEDNGTTSTKNLGDRRTLKSTYDRIGTKMDKKDPTSAKKQLSFSDDDSDSSSGSDSSHGDMTSKQSSKRSSKRHGSSYLSRDTLPVKKTLRKSITSESHQSGGTGVIRGRTSHLTHGESFSPSNNSGFNFNLNYRFSVFRPPGSAPFVPLPKKKEKISLVGILDVARRLGILKKSFAYQQFISKDQFIMVKDVSTGKFEVTDEKRFQQLDKLKRKIMFASGAPEKRHSRRRRTLLWDADELPGFKTMYKDLVKKLKQVLTPNNKLRMLWDFFLTWLMLYDLVITPMQLAFDLPFMHLLYGFTIAVDAFFLLDILINFNTGYYAKGLLVMDRKKIAWHYVQGWFLPDLVAAFPYAYIFTDDDDYENLGLEGIRTGGFVKIIKIVRLLRVFKLRWNFQKLESYIDFSALVAGIVGFIKLSFIILLIAHWLACIWHFTSVYELQVHVESWIVRAGLIDSYWFDRYVTAVYWATMTMITVGYGDITPGTTNEKILAIMAMLIASVVFAYTMNRINVILAGLDATSEQYKRALATITDYMKKKHVDKELQIKIKKYLEYALAVETSLELNEANLDAFLNQSLKDELITQIYGKILLDKIVFKQFTSDFISRAALIMKEKIYSPEDVIFLAYKHKDTNFYCINSGKVEMFHFFSSSYLKTLTKGSFFGEVSFFTGKHSGISARSVDFSTIYFLKRDEFIRLIDDFPLEREKFHSVKDKIKLYKDYSPLDSKCYSCGQMNHTVTTCPRIHLSVDKPKYIEAYIEAKNKFFKEFMRTGRRTIKNTHYCDRLQAACKKIQEKIVAGAYMNLTPKVSDYNREKTRDPTQFMALQPVLPFMAGERLKHEGSLHIGSSILPMGQAEGDEQIQIKYEIAKAATPKRFSLIFTPMVDEPKNFGQRSMVLGADVAESDIDCVQNYTYYFPHNNFSTLFPQSMLHAKTTLFDFTNQIGTPKTTLKKFANIMRNRLSVKKSQLGGIARSKMESLKPKNNLVAQSLFPRELRKLSDQGLKPKAREPRRSVLVAYAMGDEADNSEEGGYETDS